MDLEKITIIGIPREIKIEQFDLINQHIKELSQKELPVDILTKKVLPNTKATKRKIIISEDSFSFDSYKKFIKYEIRDFDENAKASPDFYIAKKNFEYKI